MRDTFRSLFRFFSSLKLAVFVILSLAFVLAYATVAESYYGMRGAHLQVYSTWWFTGLLFLLGSNVLCAALSRFPWKPRQTGFVVTHLGILILLAGSFATQQWGIDGNLPVMEGTQANMVMMPEMVLTLRDEASYVAAQIPVPEYALRKTGDLLKINLGKESLEVTEFIPRLVAEKQWRPSPLNTVGTPAVRVELSNSRFRIGEWLRVDHPSAPSELGLGPATLVLKKSWTPAEDKAVMAAPSLKSQKPVEKGPYLVLNFGGKSYEISVAETLNKWKPLGATGFEVSTDKYFPYAVVENNKLTSKSKEPVNPAVQVLARQINQKKNQKASRELARYTVFALYPEFNTFHRKESTATDPGMQFQLVVPALTEKQARQPRGRMEMYVLSDNQRLWFRTFGSTGEMKNQGFIKVGETVPTGWMDLQFQVTDWYPHALEETVPRYVERIEGTDGNFLSGVKLVKASERNPATDDGKWLLEGGAESFSVGNNIYLMQYGRRTLELPFQIYLEKFTIGMDPGTNKAATYESQVKIAIADKGLSNNSVKISMNEPLHFGGYTFYQASYQMEEGKKPISVFSVNYDPGRTIKYLGSIVMVLGIMLMFWMNPQYWEKVMGKAK